MFSGKTTSCINTAKRYIAIGKNVIMINHTIDIARNNNNKLVISHDNLHIDSVYYNNLKNNINSINQFDIIIINEGQFFGPELKDTVIQLVDIYKKIVIVSGLDGDYKKDKFGSILDLIPHAEEVSRLKAFCSICKNGTAGIFTHRIINDNNDQISIGNGDKYMALCRKHYNEVNNNNLVTDNDGMSIFTPLKI